MTTQVVPGVLIATPDAAHVAREASARIARVIREAIEAKGSASIALSGGNTPRAAYTLLAKEPIDWSNVAVFWVDERAVAATDERSNYHWAKETLLDPAKIPAGQIHRMRGDAPDLDASAREYEAAIRTHVKSKAGGAPSFDLLVMGIGDDGHTASLFPGETAVHETTRLVLSVPAKGDREARLTMTPPLIEAAANVIVLAVGKGKNGPLERAWRVNGPVDETPARIIRDVRGTIAWIIDRAAGGLGD